MHRTTKLEGADTPKHTNSMVRGQSTTSDRLSLLAKPSLSPPDVSPEPAYISASAASQWVSAELDDDELAVSPAALTLLNAFLDQMLFSFLSSARSTRLPQLRLAVPEVLKQRLGREAMASADEELREYLGEGDDEELSDFYDGHEPSTEFDLDLAWKLARLRCMVYTRLGDIEEEDALDIIEREQLDERGGQHRRFSSQSSSITPAGAIFLTSIIEYLGEQALYHAAVLAQTRMSSAQTHRRENPTGVDDSSRSSVSHIVEEIDVRRLGREGPLARIWRNWRRPLRSAQDSQSRPFSPSSPSEDGGSRRGSTTTVGTIPLPNTAKSVQQGDPAQIPLPTSEDDVNEIEVPGLAREIDDDGPVDPERDSSSGKLKRSKSISYYPASAGQPSTPTSTQTQPLIPQRTPQRPSSGRARSRSLPTPPQSPLNTLRSTRDSHGEAVPRTESTMIGNEVPGENGPVPAGSAPFQDQGPERSPKRNGVVMDAALAGAVAAGGVSLREISKDGRAPAFINRETVADRMLSSTNSAIEERAPPSAMTGSSIHNATDFQSIHVPEGQRGSTPVTPAIPTLETDPEDLALSSADERPKSTGSGLSQRRSAESGLSKRRSKHDSVPPIQVGSSSYTYSSKPGDSYIPTPVYSDFPKAPTHHKSVTITPPPREATSADPNASQQVASSAAPASRTPNDAQETVTPQWTAPLPPKYQKVGSLTAVGEPESSLEHAKERESKSSEYSERSSSSSKLLHFTRDEQGRPVPLSGRSLGNDRTDVPRAMPSPTSRAATGTPNTQPASPSIPEEPRPTTAGSQHPAEKPDFRLRTSSDDSREAVRKSSFESEAKKKSLEILIRGDETLHYTLTPKPARASEFPESGRRVLAPTPQSADYAKSVSSASNDPSGHRNQKSVSSAKTSNGLHSPPLPEENRSEPFAPMSKQQAASSRPTTSKSATPSKFRSRVEPRDAKVDPSTSRDLADYLRSTGPENDQQLPRALSSRPGTAAKTATNVPQTPRTAAQYLQGVESARNAPRLGTSSGGSVTSGRSSTSRYAPRDAKISKDTTTSALADFIREGPPRATGDHRIPRTVAPFRTTMDSDDLNVMAPSVEKDTVGRSSVATTYDDSVQSSTTSHTALLDGSGKTAAGHMNGARSVPSAARVAAQPSDKDAGPVRKQRRVRDPYAIDDSEDENLEEVATPRPRRDEESLVDFLRNTAPQANNAPAPLLAATSSAASNHNVQKKASNTGIKERLTAMSGLSRKSSSPALATSPKVEHPPAYSRGSATRAESPHLSQVGSKLDSYKPTKPTHAGYVDRVRQARSNGAVGSADYANSSEQSRNPQTPNTIKDEGGFRAFFTRRKSVKR